MSPHSAPITIYFLLSVSELAIWWNRHQDPSANMQGHQWMTVLPWQSGYGWCYILICRKRDALQQYTMPCCRQMMVYQPPHSHTDSDAIINTCCAIFCLFGSPLAVWINIHIYWAATRCVYIEIPKGSCVLRRRALVTLNGQFMWLYSWLISSSFY